MLKEIDSIIHQQQAMQGQVEFLKGCATQWKDAPGQEETDRNTQIQLVQTFYYFREGLGELYACEENFLQSSLGFPGAAEIRAKHRAVMNNLEAVYRSLVNLSCKVQLPNKESVWDSINGLCHSITQLCLEERHFSPPE
jgi:hypothetical protein